MTHFFKSHNKKYTYTKYKCKVIILKYISLTHINTNFYLSIEDNHLN
jgi:hypothetical protein